jgi:hypothetical protein
MVGNVGASFTGVTVSVKVLTVVACPSVAVTVIVVDPDAFRTGVAETVKSRLFAFVRVVVRSMSAFRSKAWLLDVTVTDKLVPALSTSETVNATGLNAESSATVRFAMVGNVGASFTGVTLSVNVRWVVAAPSDAVSVTVTGPPLTFSAGDSCSVYVLEFAPVLSTASEMFSVGSRVVLLDAAERVSALPAVSVSETVTVTALAGVSSAVV